jgi:hypothetical protein
MCTTTLNALPCRHYTVSISSGPPCPANLSVLPVFTPTLIGLCSLYHPPPLLHSWHELITRLEDTLGHSHFVLSWEGALWQGFWE